MNWVLHDQQQNRPYLQQSNNLFQSSSSNSSPSSGFDLNSKISPSVLLIIIILAIIFFVSGLLHLLVRFLLRPPNRDPNDLDNVTVLQGQLQQLFHLHDAGVDQSFIDTLPVFHYKAIIGLKNPFDCAVCLCEFEPEDKLRLLPKCSHAFHMECIDTWLLSHSTCPLCRGHLVPDFSPNNSFSPIVLVLESGSESSREIVNVNANDRENNNNDVGRTSSVLTTNTRLGYVGDNELGSSRIEMSLKSGEILSKDDRSFVVDPVDAGEKVVLLKLGKFRSVETGAGSSNVDERRCFSMGSFEYVMDESSHLQVTIRNTPMKKQSSKKPSLPLTPGHRPAMSECDCESRREFNGFFENIKSIEANGSFGSTIVTKGNNNANSISRNKKESFSISKIWLRGEKDKQKLSTEDSSRRAFSFRFPAKNAATNEDDGDKKVMKNENENGKRINSEIGIERWEVNSSFDEENQSINAAKTPSFARRTLQWLVGRQNKVVHSSFTPNV